ncbi:alpha/beta fold hydrolase [Saccharopolyspora sp. 5N708]|uniref:alpha/beta fold hydrolase n=1 Tax=Saccharopolyspora sp. 5N708 TaxID=3457424 RepID=UPI003FCF55D0
MRVSGGVLARNGCRPGPRGPGGCFAGTSDGRTNVSSGPADLVHGMADIEPGLRLHHVTAGAGVTAAGEGPRTLVLLHGFPQTWWEWRRVIGPLAEVGFRVVAPDYRGAGESWRPVGGYDKRTMASDVHTLLHQHLGVDGPVVLVGHDIGLMVAYAYAQSYRDDVSHLVLADARCPAPPCSTGSESIPGCGTSPSTAPATWPKCWSPGGNAPTCRRSSTPGSPIRRRSPRRISTFTSTRTPHRARCGPVLRFTAPSTRTPRTTAPPCSATASWPCRCWRWAA